MALTKKDLQDVSKTIGEVIDKRKLTTRSFTREYLDEALANFRLSLNQDLIKLATKQEVEEIVKDQLLEQGIATKHDLGSLKQELVDYIHEVAEQIVDGFDATMKEHVGAYHGQKTAIPN